MQWIKSGIESPSKSEVIGRCGGDEKNRTATRDRQKSNAKTKWPLIMLFFNKVVISSGFTMNT